MKADPTELLTTTGESSPRYQWVMLSMFAGWIPTKGSYWECCGGMAGNHDPPSPPLPLPTLLVMRSALLKSFEIKWDYFPSNNSTTATGTVTITVSN